MPPLDIIAYTPPAGVWAGLDTAGDDDSPGYVITPELGAELRAEGIRWVARYTRLDGTVLENPRPGGDWRGVYSLSIAESRWILEAGLGIVLVQFGTFGDAADGARYGAAAALATSRLGFPGGAHHFVDVEGSGPAAAGSKACRSYVEAWTDDLLAGGPSAPLGGMYLTGQVPLSARKLYALRGVTAYWSAAGPVPPNPLDRGYTIEQQPRSRVCGILADRDTLRPDRMGHCATLIATPEIALDWHLEALTQTLGDLHTA